MLQNLRHTVKHTFIYSLGNLAVKIIGLILLPLYTSHLTTSEYGILSILEITSMFLTTMFSFNISTAMMRWWAEAKDEIHKKTYVFTGFAFLFTVNLLLFGIFFPFSKDFSVLLFKNADFKIYFQILFASIFFDILNRYILSLIRILEKSVLFIVVSSLKLLVILSLTVYFIVELDKGVEGIILAQLIGHIVGFIVLLPLLLKNIVFKFDYAELKRMLAYSFPLAMGMLVSTVFNMGDRYVLKFLWNDALVGIYSLAFKIAGFVNFFMLVSFQSGFQPFAYKMYKQENSARFFAKTTTYLTLILTYASVGLALFSPEMLMIFSPENKDYWEAAQYVGPICLLVVLYGLKFMFNLNFHLSKKTYFIPFLVGGLALLNIGLDFLFIPEMKIYGAILASFISLVILLVFLYFISRKFYYVPYEIGKIFYIIVLGIIFAGAGYFMTDLDFILKFSLKLLLVMIFPLMFLNKWFLENIERETLKNFLQKWKSPKDWRKNLKELKKQ